MNKETLLKYLDFLKIECLRYASDDRVDDNEFKLLKIEIDRFLKLFDGSNFDQKTKSIILKIDFRLQPKTESSFLDVLTNIVSSGYLHESQEEQNLANTLKKIALELENAIFEIKAFV